MDQLNSQVARARRRLTLQRFFGVATWSLFIGLVVSAVGIAIPKIWHLPVDPTIWAASWIGGAVAISLLNSLVVTLIVRQTPFEAATEIDRRFGLKERVASSLALTPEERDTEAGKALIDDAVRRVSKVDVKERFAVSVPRRAAMVLAPAAIIAALVFLPDAKLDPKTVSAAAAPSAERQQVKTSAQALKQRLEQKRKEAAEKGLEDAAELLKKFEKAVDEMAKKGDVDKKKALVKLNDLAQELEKRRQEMGDSKQMREQLQGLKDLNRGPADKIAKAIKEGNFQKASEELSKLAEKLKSGDLNDEEKQQLAKQVEQMKDKLQQLVDAHDQMKRELQEQIKKAEQSGDMAKAGELQRQLDKLSQQNKAMSRLQEMANKMGECQKCMQNGDNKAAAAQMAELGEQLDKLSQEMAKLESLDDVLDQLTDAKDAMNCENCGGEGCEMCNGMGMGMGQFGQGMGMGQGDGMGEGRGEGYRPEEETATGAYDSKVAAQPKPGEAIVAGEADGPNRAGVAREESKAPLSLSVGADADPLADQRLPRSQRDHAKQYFDLLREGQK